MKIKTKSNALYLVLVSVVILLLPITGARAEKIKLICTVDVEENYSTGNTTKNKEKIQVDIETIENYIFIFANGIDASFSMSNKPSESSEEKLNSSDGNMFELTIDQTKEIGTNLEHSQYVKIDRNTGVMYYRYIATGELIKTVSGTCEKINQKKRLF